MKRLIAIVAVLAFDGCTSLAQLDEMCYQGDAEACLKAQRLEERIAERSRNDKGLNCPDGYVAYRAGSFGEWSCVERNAMMRAMGL